MASGRKQQVSSGVGVALVALLVVAAAARAGADTICNVDDSAAGACLSYCKKSSRESRPSNGCCNAVRGIDINCACGYIRNYRSFISLAGYDVNRGKQIPSKCGFGPSNPCG